MPLHFKLCFFLALTIVVRIKKARERQMVMINFQYVEGPDKNKQERVVVVHFSAHCFSELSEVLWGMLFRIALKMDLPYVGGAIIFVVFAVFATLTIAVLLVMEGLSAFLHTLRLHWLVTQYTINTPEGFMKLAKFLQDQCPILAIFCIDKEGSTQTLNVWYKLIYFCSIVAKAYSLFNLFSSHYLLPRTNQYSAMKVKFLWLLSGF